MPNHFPNTYYEINKKIDFILQMILSLKSEINYDNINI